MNIKKLKQSKDFQDNNNNSNYYASQISDSKYSTFYESFKKFSTHQKQSSLNQTSGKSTRGSKLLISSEKMKAIKCGGSPKINKHQSVLKENKNNNKTTLEDDSFICQQASNKKVLQQSQQQQQYQLQGSNGKNSYIGAASPLVKQKKKQSSKQLLQQNFDEYFKENNNKMKKKNKSLGNLFDKKKLINNSNNQTSNQTNNNSNNVNPARSGQDLSFEQMAQYFNTMGLTNRNSAINTSNTNFSSINVKKIDLVSNKSPLSSTDSTNFLTSRNKQLQQQQSQQQSQQSLTFKKLQSEEEGQEFSRYFQSKQQSLLQNPKKTHKTIHQENQHPYKKYKLLRKKFKKENKKLDKENQSLKQQLSSQTEKLRQLQSDHSQTTKSAMILQFLLEFSSQLNLPLTQSPIPSNLSSFILHRNDFHYFADKLLGKGGFGEVYQGKLQQTKDVAVKIIRMNANEEQIRFLQGELIAMIVCDHQNLVKLHGVCIDGQKQQNSKNNVVQLTVYIVMELLITDLRKLIFHQNKIHLNRPQKYRILIQILKGLNALHNSNYVHCDLKMQNILLDSKLNAKISDFGLSKSLTSGKTKQTITGGFSERNSAFEYLVEDKVSTKGDIWSFGILMYELLKEKIAWGGLTGPQTVAKVSIQTPFYSCNAKIGDETDTIIENCLNYDHSKRPSAEMLIQQIQQLMEKV